MEMFSRAALALFALLIVEFVLFGFVVRSVGAAACLGLSIMAALLGIVVLRRHVPGMVGESLRRVMETGSADDAQVADKLLVALAGVLLIVPGFATGLAGVGLLLPPVRGIVGAPARRWLATLVPSSFGAFPFFTAARGANRFTRPDVVDVDIVSPEPTRSAPNELD